MKTDKKIDIRKYGNAPFSIALLHGGPGASGEMEPVAKALLQIGFNPLEPMQNEISLEGQVQELKLLLEKYGDLPITLVGYSWGAMLGFIFAGRYPELVKKLIMVSSGPIEEEYAKDISKTRIDRLNEEDRSKVDSLLKSIDNLSPADKSSIFLEIDNYTAKSDFYNPLTDDKKTVEFSYEIYEKVWLEFKKFRANGRMLDIGEKVKCPQ
ncbi:MAG: alpha/beta fold hydrolase [Alphaproteobacteria bacterium]